MLINITRPPQKMVIGNKFTLGIGSGLPGSGFSMKYATIQHIPYSNKINRIARNFNKTGFSLTLGLSTSLIIYLTRLSSKRFKLSSKLAFNSLKFTSTTQTLSLEASQRTMPSLLIFQHFEHPCKHS